MMLSQVQLNNTSSVAEQNNYAMKIINGYIVYDLDNQPKIPLNNSTLKNCFFRATNIAKTDKSKHIYTGS